MNDRLNSILVVIVPFFSPLSFFQLIAKGEKIITEFRALFLIFRILSLFFVCSLFALKLIAFFVVSERNLSWYSCLTRFSFSFRRINYSGGGQVEGSE